MRSHFAFGRLFCANFVLIFERDDAGAQAGPPPQAGYGSSWNWNMQQNGSAPPPAPAAAGYPSQGAPHPAAHQGKCEREVRFKFGNVSCISLGPC